MSGADATAMLRAKAREILLRQTQDGTRVWPCSEGQTALWYLHQSAPRSPAYNVGFALALADPPDIAALQRACQAMVDRHDALRARFEDRDGVLWQRILADREVPLRQTALDGATPEALRETVQAHHDAPFDLETGPLYRFELFRQSARSHVLLVTAHHIVCDGWTLWMLMDELGARYAGDSTETGPGPSYRDYVLRERAALTAPGAAASWRYWEQRLEGVPPALTLPIAGPRPSEPSLSGLSCPLRLGAGLTARLRSRAREAGATPYALLLAAFQALLHRYSGESDIVIGVPVAGMREGAFARVAGHFVNQLPIRSGLDGDRPFDALVAETLEHLLDAREHGGLPFGMLVKRLAPPRHPGCSPVFQSSIVLQRAPQPGSVFDLLAPEGESRPGNWGGLGASAFDIRQQEGQLDLTLELIDGEAEIFGRLKADAALFGQAEVAQIAESFVTLLADALEAMDRPLGALRLQPQAARALCLDAAGDIATRFPVETDLGSAFRSTAARHPDRIALNGVGFALSYRDLDARSDLLAAELQRRGLAGQRIGLCVERSVEMLVGMLGILKAGGAYVPIDPQSPAERQRFILADSGVEMLLTQAHLVDRAGEGVDVLCLDSDWPAIAQGGGAVPVPPGDPDRAAYVIYTSGTTGRPKGVVITHRNVLRLFLTTDGYYGFVTEDVWPLLHSFAFDVSVWEIWGAFLYGGRLLMVPHETVRAPDDLVTLLVAEGATVLNQTPSAFRLLTKAATLPDLAKEGRLRLISFAGEALEPQILRPWVALAGDAQPQIVNMYGITETTVHAMYRRIRAEDIDRPSSMIGEPFPDLRIYLLDDRMEPVPFGVRGEIYVGGDGVGVGYHNRPELTAQRFVADPFGREPGGRLYRSGDLAVRRRNGDVEYGGRADRQVKLRGFRIELGEVEHALASHPALRSAIVRPVGQGEETRLIGYAVVRDGAQSSVQALRQHVAGRLPDYMVPADVVFLDAFPLNANGKIDDAALPRPDRGQDSVAAMAPPRDWTEQRLLRIWQNLLRRDTLGIDDNFFALGGHSFLAVAMMAEIEREFGVRLPVSALMSRQTVARLAETLRAGAGGAWSPIVPIREGQGERRLFCVAGGGGNVVYFYHLAAHLPEEIGFYGIQSFGLDGAPPKASVEEAARGYLAHIRALQPSGPYLLAGHCFGGWVAYEIGRQLVEMGEEVELLAVLDAPGPGLAASCGAGRPASDDPVWVAKFAKAFSEDSDAALDLPDDLSGETQDTLLRRIAGGFEAAGIVPCGAGEAQVRALFRVFLSNSTAIYRPEQRPTLPIALFRAAQAHRDYDYSAVDDAARAFGWDRFATGPVAVTDTPGHHITMLAEPHVAELAHALSRKLTQ
ncbi:amino acid adenylation domain-containing protein [Salipiger sp. P9]|uniref:non-ribosomal peptide synthetase n=1 Tax=Salipiger pentaromativorans TaxID=2943193 RepID=UPI0021585FD0|nr:amino acid adenylation domain-containing protein [Salipiger pentaromativorans]MCR8547596.1 amino acid adenylation domain-containing protein [Salipiger pentaromativorans]